MRTSAARVSTDAAFQTAPTQGIEIYTGTVPAQYNGSDARCGVIVIWTRASAARAPGESTP
jgi:outer membrane cobalamin receptor